MSVQLTPPSHLDQIARASRRRSRAALAVAAVAAAIAAGGVAASQILLPDDRTGAPESQYLPSDQALRSLSNTVAAEYRTGLITAPSRSSAAEQRVLREIRDGIANQYRSR
jgi:hypothetical protein